MTSEPTDTPCEAHGLLLHTASRGMYQSTRVDSEKLLVYEGEVSGRKVSILIDSGSSAQFISTKLALAIEAPLTEKKVGNTVTLANGSKEMSRHKTTITYSLCDFSEEEDFHLLNLATYDLVLGRPWLNRHNPRVDWPSGSIGLSRGTESYVFVTKNTSTSSARNTQSGHVQGPNPGCNLNHVLMTLLVTDVRNSISVGVTGEAVEAQAKTPEERVANNPGTSVITREYPNPAKSADCTPEMRERLQTLLEEFKDVVPTDPDFMFPFPPKRALDFEIKMIPHDTIPSKRVYKMSPVEQEEMKKQLDELISRGFIRPSQSAYGSPVLFVKKKNGQLRMCVDYRAINSLTVKWKYPIPDINDLLDQLRGFKYYTKIDLSQAYHQVRVAESSKQYTAMLTKWGLFEWNCLSFGLSNAPSHFSRLMMDVFADVIDKFVLVFLDDILIYSETQEEHLKHTSD